MAIQSESQLEQSLLDNLVGLGYEKVVLKDEFSMLKNLKLQLEKLNYCSFSDNEFFQITNHLSKGNPFEKSFALRDRLVIKKDDGKDFYVQFFDSEHFCQNIYQVSNQITINGKYQNRYDVTILINGLPLVQIELKRAGLEIKEAFNQVCRYHRHSYGAGAGLFGFIQIFVISNGVNTKYYSNNRHQSFKQTFHWSDEENKKINKLDEFAKVFLEPCFLSKMISSYIVLNITSKVPMVLRPYQYYACEKILQKVSQSNEGGYIWHTTGSGKTLTSFKTSQLLLKNPSVKKVLFVVDRKDLDYQTTNEFNSFSAGSVDGTDNTHQLVKQLKGDTRLIVTTIQKLNTAITRDHFLTHLQELKDQKIVFIFDECHRSQFGETHKRIKKFFTNAQMFGFTGTPILAQNNQGGKTTFDLFGQCLHKYQIQDAIADENVLKFSVEYIGKYYAKDEPFDIKVSGIDTKEILESEKRIDKIVDYILAIHDQKTHSKLFNSIFAISNIETLSKYYENFKQKKLEGKHNLNIATIFSYGVNEEDFDSDGIIGEKINEHSRDKLESYIKDYNYMFGTAFSTADSKSFYNYYQDISKKVREKHIDILLVVNMFLTGFDSKQLNTLYVDKNLQYHGLLQAFSRTNRILNEKKSQGNIVCFRNLKNATDEAIELFSNKQAIEQVIMQPYSEYEKRFNELSKDLLEFVPTLESIDELQTEEDKLKFVQIFRDIIRTKNILSSFSDFDETKLVLAGQDFENIQSKYLDMYESLKNSTEKVSILNDVDFEIELLHKDEINVTYILRLLARLASTTDPITYGKLDSQINSIINSSPNLRNKKDLIQDFIDNQLQKLQDLDKIEDEYYDFLEKKKQIAFDELVKQQELDYEKFKTLVDRMIFTQKEPLRQDIAGALKTQPSILKRNSIIENISQKLKSFIEKFYT